MPARISPAGFSGSVTTAQISDAGAFGRNVVKLGNVNENAIVAAGAANAATTFSSTPAGQNILNLATPAGDVFLKVTSADAAQTVPVGTSGSGFDLVDVSEGIVTNGT